jgi:hypothetical protein
MQLSMRAEARASSHADRGARTETGDCGRENTSALGPEGGSGVSLCADGRQVGGWGQKGGC